MAVIVPIVGEYQGTAFRRAEQDIEKLGRTARRSTGPMSKFSGAIRGSLGSAALAGAAGGAIAGLVSNFARLATDFVSDGVSSALAEEKALSKLSDQLHKTGIAFDITEVATFIDDLQYATGVSDDELRPALQSLVTVTGDLGTAQQLLRTAIDASVGSNKELSSVVTAVSKAAAGNTTSLKRMFPALDSTVIASKDLAAIQENLISLYGGQAATALASTAGQFELLKIAIDEAGESLGKGVIAGFTGASSSTQDLVQALRDAQPDIEKIGQVLGQLANVLASNADTISENVNAWQALLDLVNGNWSGWWDHVTAMDDVGNSANNANTEVVGLTLGLGQLEGQMSRSKLATLGLGAVLGTVSDQYGTALGASLEGFQQDIADAIKAGEDANTAAEAAAEEAARKLRERIARRSQEITDRAKTQLQSARDEVANFRSITAEFKQGITEFGAVSSLQAEASVPISAEMITANMRQRLAAITAFSTKIKELKTKGLPASVLVDIINQGPFDGLRYAEAILASRTAISDIASLTAGINRQAGIIGNIGAEATTGTTLGNLQAATSFVVQAGGINITVNGEVTAKTVKEIKDAVRDSLKRVSREAKGSRKPGGRG